MALVVNCSFKMISKQTCLQWGNATRHVSRNLPSGQIPKLTPKYQINMNFPQNKAILQVKWSIFVRLLHTLYHWKSIRRNWAQIWRRTSKKRNSKWNIRTGTSTVIATSNLIPFYSNLKVCVSPAAPTLSLSHFPSGSKVKLTTKNSYGLDV